MEKQHQVRHIVIGVPIIYLDPPPLRTCSFLASSHDTPSRMCDCGPAEILSALRLSLIYKHGPRSEHSNDIIINISSQVSGLTCCCSFLNSLGLVFLGTNCSADSILTGVLCVGEFSATHWRQNQNVRLRPSRGFATKKLRQVPVLSQVWNLVLSSTELCSLSNMELS